MHSKWRRVQNNDNNSILYDIYDFSTPIFSSNNRTQQCTRNNCVFLWLFTSLMVAAARYAPQSTQAPASGTTSYWMYFSQKTVRIYLLKLVLYWKGETWLLLSLFSSLLLFDMYFLSNRQFRLWLRTNRWFVSVLLLVAVQFVLLVRHWKVRPRVGVAGGGGAEPICPHFLVGDGSEDRPTYVKDDRRYQKWEENWDGYVCCL